MYESKVAELETLKTSLAASEQARSDLQQTLSETGQKMASACDKAKQMEDLIVSENKEVNKQNLVLASKYAEVC